MANYARSHNPLNDRGGNGNGNGNGKWRTIHSWMAFVIYCNVLIAAFIWTTYKSEAPFEVFAWALTAGFGGYLGQRLYKRHERFRYEEYEYQGMRGVDNMPGMGDYGNGRDNLGGGSNDFDIPIR